MKKAITFILFFGLISCNQSLKSKSLSADNSSSNEAQAPVNDEQIADGQIDEMQQTYTFLRKSAYWQKAKQMLPIPSDKKCRNTYSYGYLGLARYIYKNLKSDFPILTFRPSPRYAPFFSGFPSNTDNEELFFSDYGHEKNWEIHLWVQQNLKRPLTLTSLTLGSQHDHDRHCRHRAGVSTDVRPFPGDRPTTWNSSNYIRSENLAFIRMLASRPDINVIFFNDPEILNDKKIAEIKKQRQAAGNPLVFQSANGHDNHIHYEFALDPEIEEITEYTYQRLVPITPSSIIDWDAEFSEH